MRSELRGGEVAAAGQAEGVGAVQQTRRSVGALGGEVVQADHALKQVEDGLQALAGDAARRAARLSSHRETADGRDLLNLRATSARVFKNLLLHPASTAVDRANSSVQVNG